MRLSPLASRRFTLVEVMVTVGLAAVVAGAVLASMLTTQQAVTDGLTLQTATARARWVADQLATELQDMNYHSVDMNPYVFSQVTTLDYRKVVGYDDAAKKVKVDPTRASGNFRRIQLTNGRVVLITPTSNISFGRGISALALTLIPQDIPGGIEFEQVQIKVTVQLKDSQGKIVQASVEMKVPIRNRATEVL